MADETGGGPLHPDTAKERGQTLRLTGQILAMTGDRLPTPNAYQGKRGGSQHPEKKRAGGHQVNLDDVTEKELPDFQGWGKYEPAIRRWEAIQGPVPSPTQPSKTGKAQLSPLFVEWMMGLEKGWVTDPEIGLTRNEQLRALGNGVVPAQAFLALQRLEGERF